MIGSLSWLARDGDIDWSRAIVDSCSVRAVCGGSQTGPNPTHRAERGSKRHVICDGQGVPLAIRLTGANRNDSQEALALVDAIPHHCRRLRGRYDRRADIHEAFLSLGCALVCWHSLRKSWATG